MIFKIAIASSDGATVNQHFGRARQFRIYEKADETFSFVEERSAAPACGGSEHNDDLLEQMAALIADCRAVVVSQIGATAMDVLIAQRTLPFTLPGSIDAALATLQDSKLLKFVRK